MTDCILRVKNGIKPWPKWHGWRSHSWSVPRIPLRTIFWAIPILIATCQPAVTQNSASLTIAGVMPAVQRLQISSAPINATPDQLSVTMNAGDNAGIRYAVTLESKTTHSRSNAAPIVYQVRYDRQSLTLTSRPLKLVSGKENKSTEAVLQISSPGQERNDILLLTLVSQ
jgi:hypothetical protein